MNATGSTRHPYRHGDKRDTNPASGWNPKNSRSFLWCGSCRSSWVIWHLMSCRHSPSFPNCKQKACKLVLLQKAPEWFLPAWLPLHGAAGLLTEAPVARGRWQQVPGCPEVLAGYSECIFPRIKFNKLDSHVAVRKLPPMVPDGTAAILTFHKEYTHFLCIKGRESASFSAVRTALFAGRP